MWPPGTKVFEAIFPMDDHVCNGRRYRLRTKEDTGQEVEGKRVDRYVFDLVEDEESCDDL